MFSEAFTIPEVLLLLLCGLSRDLPDKYFLFLLVCLFGGLFKYVFIDF